MRLKAFIAGVLLIILLIPVELLLGPKSILIVVVTVGLYAICGIILGFLGPDGGWRSGFWLIVPWLLLILLLPLHILFADPVPINLKHELQGFIVFLMTLVASCLGAEVGALLKQQRKHK